MRPYNRKLIAFYVYHMLRIQNPFKFKYDWMADWIARSKYFSEAREAAERIVALDRKM
jgi:hypothetical protein